MVCRMRVNVFGWLSECVFMSVNSLVVSECERCWARHDWWLPMVGNSRTIARFFRSCNALINFIIISLLILLIYFFCTFFFFGFANRTISFLLRFYLCLFHSRTVAHNMYNKSHSIHDIFFDEQTNTNWSVSPLNFDRDSCHWQCFSFDVI